MAAGTLTPTALRAPTAHYARVHVPQIRRAKVFMRIQSLNRRILGRQEGGGIFFYSIAYENIRNKNLKAMSPSSCFLRIHHCPSYRRGKDQEIIFEYTWHIQFI